MKPSPTERTSPNAGAEAIKHLATPNQHDQPVIGLTTRKSTMFQSLSCPSFGRSRDNVKWVSRPISTAHTNYIGGHSVDGSANTFMDVLWPYAMAPTPSLGASAERGVFELRCVWLLISSHRFWISKKHEQRVMGSSISHHASLSGIPAPSLGSFRVCASGAQVSVMVE